MMGGGDDKEDEKEGRAGEVQRPTDVELPAQEDNVQKKKKKTNPRPPSKKKGSNVV
jgi:hypothetical protein